MRALPGHLRAHRDRLPHDPVHQRGARLRGCGRHLRKQALRQGRPNNGHPPEILFVSAISLFFWLLTFSLYIASEYLFYVKVIF